MTYVCFNFGLDKILFHINNHNMLEYVFPTSISQTMNYSPRDQKLDFSTHSTLSYQIRTMVSKKTEFKLPEISFFEIMLNTLNTI